MPAGSELNRGVSVVVPTIGRLSLWAAIESALACASPALPVEVLVCADLPDGALDEEWKLKVGDRSVRAQLLYSGGKQGACVARNIGARAARMNMIAFLDDDDLFLSNKLETQVSLLESAGSLKQIVAGRARYHMLNGRVSDVPRCVYTGGQIGDYLFERRRLSPDRNLIPTPTWLMYTEFALSVGWRDGLARHQDWDFLIRAQHEHCASFVQIEDLVAEVHTESVSSVTSSAGIHTSFDWAESIRDALSDKAFVDFVVGQPVRHAFQSREFRLGFSFARRALRVRRPSVRATALALSGLISRSLLARLMSLRGASATRGRGGG